MNDMQMEVTAKATTEVPLVELVLNIKLNQDDHRRLLSVGQSLELMANYFLEQYSRGGVLLPAVKVKYLERLADRPIKVAEHVLDVVESGINRCSPNGNLTVTYSVDPAWASPLEDLARAQSRTPQEIVQEAMAIVFTNSWLYALDCSGGTLHFTKEMREELERSMGQKQVTGADVVSWVKQHKPVHVSKIRQEVRERLEQKAVQ